MNKQEANAQRSTPTPTSHADQRSYSCSRCCSLIIDKPCVSFTLSFLAKYRGYFHSPIAYIVLIFFLIVSGIDFYFQVSFMNQRQVQYTVQEAFFNSVFFWFAFVLIFPLITMRLFAEEFKLGTIEPLTTVPVRDWQIVLAKFFGALRLLRSSLDPDAALLCHLPQGHE